ncbi:MAG: hypothetical protein E7K47_21740, partial [Acidovorax sp.]|nr:hypothetical protein [Acidovorax sp.]
MDALDTAMRERSKAIEANLGYIERGWNGIKSAAKDAWDAMLNVGRSATIGDQLYKAQAELERKLNEPLAVDNPAMRASREKGIERLRAEIWALQEKANAEDMAAAASEHHAQQLQARTKWDEAGNKFLKDSERLERDLAKAREEGAAAGKTQAEIETRLQQIRDSYNKKTGGGASAENKELRDRQRIYAELVGVSSTYYSELENYQKQRAAGVVTEEQYVAAVEKLIAKQPFATELAKESAKAAKEEAAALNEAAQQRYKAAQAAEQSVNGLMAGNQQLRDEIQLIGLSAAEQMEVIRLREEAVLLVKEQHLAEMARAEDLTGTMTRERIALEQEIELRRERLNLMGDKATKEQFAESNREMNREWQR